jgi:hypothetical protein
MIPCCAPIRNGSSERQIHPLPADLLIRTADLLILVENNQSGGPTTPGLSESERKKVAQIDLLYTRVTAPLSLSCAI